jgi:cyclic pyranopterin phosphate synthase
MCVMPTDGIFCIVIRSGALRAGDTIRIVPEDEA